MKLYETLRELSEMDFSNVEEEIFLKLNLYERNKFSVIIDVTDTYFEGNTVDEEPRRGKDFGWDAVFYLLSVELGRNLKLSILLKKIYEKAKRFFQIPPCLLADRGLNNMP